MASRYRANYSVAALEQFTTACRLLSGNDALACEDAFWLAESTGRQGTRAYHDAPHSVIVAGGVGADFPIESWKEAVRFRAGINHDAVYYQVDARKKSGAGIIPGIQKYLDRYICNENGVVVIRDAPGLNEDKLFHAALKMFGYVPGQTLVDGPTTVRGHNEFLSALYALEQGRELGISDKHLLAEMAHIRGTVFIGPPDEFDNIYRLLRETNALLPDAERLSDQEMLDTMVSAVDMANIDVAGFIQPTNTFIEDTYHLMWERLPKNVSPAQGIANYMDFITNDARFLENMIAQGSIDGKLRIYHTLTGREDIAFSVDGVPVAEAEAGAITRLHFAGEYLRANAVATALLIAGHMIGRPEEAEPSLNHVTIPMLTRHRIHAPHPPPAELTEAGHEALKRLGEGLAPYPTAHIAAYLLANIGSEGIRALADLADRTGILPAQASPPRYKDARPGMNTRETAQAFLDAAQSLATGISGVNVSELMAAQNQTRQHATRVRETSGHIHQR